MPRKTREEKIKSDLSRNLQPTSFELPQSSFKILKTTEKSYIENHSYSYVAKDLFLTIMLTAIAIVAQLFIYYTKGRGVKF
jgi:hypothetical protein